MEQATEFIAEQGWTPQVKARRNGITYLYAARRFGKKMKWCYMCSIKSVGGLTEEVILDKIKKIA